MKTHRKWLYIVVLLLVIGALACNGGPQKPSVEILSPPTGSRVSAGELVEIEYRASDASAVARVDLEVDGQVVDSQRSPVTEGQPTMTGVLTWGANEPGEYTLIVHAYNNDRVASDPVGVNIVVGDGDAEPGSTVTVSLILPGGTKTVPAADATATTTRPAASPAASATRPAATPTTPPPTPTQRQAAPPPPTATQPPPPPPTATKPPPSPTPTTELASLWVENYTSVDICEVYFSFPWEDWGPNRLLDGSRIYAGQSALWTIPPGDYDLWALDCDGNGLVVISNQPIYGSWTWEIYEALPPPPPPAEPITLGVYNYCSEAIGELYIYQPSDPDNGPNQIAGYSIPAGGSQFFGIESGIWAIDAYDVGGYWLDSMPPTEFLPGSDPMWNACAQG
jgi:hypothetical protein